MPSPLERGIASPLGAVARLAAELRADLRPRALLQSLIAGVVAGGISVAISISFAALIFSGPLAEHLPFGLGLALFSSACVGLVTALGSSLRIAVGGVQDNTTAILGVATAAIAARVATEALLPTAVAAIVTASIVVGAALYLVGRLRLGAIIRYMPFPVVGGFYAATGFLIIQGAADVARDVEADLFTFDAAMVWAPGLIIGIAILLAARIGTSTLTTPLVLAVGVVVLRGGMAITGVGADAATARGWLFGPYADQPSWSADTVRLLADADWGAVGAEWITLASLAVIASISMLLNISGLEHAGGVDADADRELRVAGIGSLASAAGGGMPGYLYLGDSVILHRIAGHRRLAAVLTALMSVVVLVFGTGILGIVPKAVVAGVLFGLGLMFLVEWLWDARRRMSMVDLALVWVIGLAVLVAGFIAAIALGVVIAIGLFAVRYSRVDVVRRTYPLAATSSTIDRPAHQRDIIESEDAAVVVEVRGFLFFGTATRVFDAALRAVEDRTRFIVFDLTGTTGIDSSLNMAYLRFERAASTRGLALAFAGVPSQRRAPIDAVAAASSVPVVVVAELDDGLRWAEEQILHSADDSDHAPEVPFAVILERLLGASDDVAAVIGHTEVIEIGDGEAVITTGEPAPGLFFLESGRLQAEVESDDGSPIRLREMLPGTVIGEISLYRGGVATATVRSIGISRLRQISSEAMHRIERDEAAVAAAIHRFAAAVLAERVLHAERGLRALR
jgi:SulP family sulfate permease